MYNYMEPEKPGHFATCIAEDDVDYIELICCNILNDAKTHLTSYGSTDCTRDQKTITKRLRHEGAGFATTALPAFFNQFALMIEGGEPSFEGFKTRPSSRLPVFLGGLTRMVLSQDDQDSLAFKYIYMLTCAFKKLKGDYPESVLSDNLDKFIETDVSLLSVQYTDRDVRSLLKRAKGYIDTLFETCDIDDIIPRPGPGAVNTPLKPHMRYEPHVRYAQLEDALPYRNWFYTNAFGFRSSVRKYFALPRRDYPTSRMAFVHKYVGKPRGICIEENETQYLQQGLKALLYKKIESHPMTKGRVNFTSQNINRELALKSSSDLSFSTIDMSAASDRVARDLVFILFRDTPILEYLNALSTRIIEFPKDVRLGRILAQKFAPMGSAICFPVMAIVHFALCKAIVATSGARNARKASKQIYVYGDDILCPAEHTQAIFTKLEWFGMKINREKSFYRSPFRESCGLHAYKGVEVTPVYINYTLNLKHDSADSTRLLSSLAKEHLYYRNGMDATAAVVRRHIAMLYGQLPKGSVSSRLLCYKRDDLTWLDQKRFATRKRYNAVLQRWEYFLRVVVPRNIGSLCLLGAPALLRKYLINTYEDAALFMDFDALMIVRRWVSESDLGRST